MIALALLGCVDPAEGLRETYGVGPDMVAEVYTLQTARGTLQVAVGVDGYPMFVGWEVDTDAGYWTATVDYVWAMGGVCTDDRAVWEAECLTR